MRTTLARPSSWFTPYRMVRCNGTPPWFAIGPVFDRRERLAGLSVSFGERCLAIHRPVR